MEKKEGMLTAEGIKIALVSARFNDFLVNSLVGGAEDAFLRHGGEADNITLYKVPGAFEIPFAVKKVALLEKFDAIIALGAVIRGATPHFDIVAAESAKGIASVGLELDIPVINGILTTDTIEQAVERAGTKAGNKGSEAMLCALEMVDLFKE